ncbi:MAG TPA: hypothetical protein VFO29_02725 [Candidatus Rubrimentiphilum sp.]|nr:hypothetical protein [Candidatus Rubrimentiphilum sp.]
MLAATALTLLGGCGQKSASAVPAVTAPPSTAGNEVFPAFKSEADQVAVEHFLEQFKNKGVPQNWVFLTASKQFYASRPELLQQTDVYQPVDASGLILANASGETIVAPPKIPRGIRPLTNSFSTTTGALRATMFVPGYSAFGGYLYLPSKDSFLTVLNGHPYDTGYIYSGGWGSDGFAVDAGLQYSPKNDNYNLFYLVQGVPGLFVGATVPSGSNGFFAFYSGTDGTDLTVQWDAGMTPSGCNLFDFMPDCSYVTSYFFGIQLIGTTGWKSFDPGIQVKRVVSIAEPQGNNSYNLGDFFGLCKQQHSSAPCDTTPLIAWTSPANLCEGVDPGNGGSANPNLICTTPITASLVQQYFDNPINTLNCGTPGNPVCKIIVNWSDPSDETDAIYLHP